MKEIFISYSSVDLSQATTVRNVLEDNGFSCWMAPRDIPGGSNYTKEIPIAIRNCKVFVLILSKNAQSSHWVLKELDSAVNGGKVILPFMLEECTLNDEFNFLLTGAQRYAAYQKKAEALETLIGRIRGILDVSPEEKEVSIQESSEEVVNEILKPKVKKVKEKPMVDYFSEAKCPACGSTELVELKGKVKAEGAKEGMFKLLIPAMAIVCVLVCFCLAPFIFSGELTWLPLLLLIGAVGGGIWGNYMFRSLVKRNRIRNGFSSTCYRCKRCKKVFDFKEPLEN